MKNKKNYSASNKEHYPLIRTIYLYLFALVGLALLVSGAVRFVNMGLKAFVFTKAEQAERIDYKRPPMAPIAVEEVEGLKENKELSKEQVILIENWLEEYQQWQKEEGKINYLLSKRHREAATNTSLILVGLPLYLYHWFIIRRETKDKKEA